MADALRQLTLVTPYVGDAGSTLRRNYLEAIETITQALAKLPATEKEP